MPASVPKRYYVGAHIGLWEPDPENGQTWDNEVTFPSRFDQVRFDAVDVLHVGHFVTTKDGRFTFGTVGASTIEKRFEHIVMVARSMNPHIKILVEQMYSGNEGFDNLEKLDSSGNIDTTATAAMVDTYTNSVRNFLHKWQLKPDAKFNGVTVSMHLDGYDIDHEGSVRKQCTKDVLSQLRVKLDKLTQQDDKKRHFILGPTPYNTRPEALLDESMAHSCDIINMQRYDGGTDWKAEDYLGAIKGLVPGKLTYGIQIETPNLNSEFNDTIEKIAQVPAMTAQVPEVTAQIPAMTAQRQPFRGIWTWRLASGD